MEKGLTDEDLMLRYRDGDVAAFGQLYNRHKGGLYRYLLRKCGNEATSEELFQDVWMKLIKARERYEVKAKFTTYLYQLAHNRFVDHYRKQKTSDSINQLHGDCEVDTLAGDLQGQPEQKVVLQEQAQTLLQLIDLLPDEQREVFILREEEGMSIAEIAEVTNVNVETAKSRLRYAVNKLRTGMLEDG